MGSISKGQEKNAFIVGSVKSRHQLVTETATTTNWLQAQRRGLGNDNRNELGSQLTARALHCQMAAVLSLATYDLPDSKMSSLLLAQVKTRVFFRVKEGCDDITGKGNVGTTVSF